MEDARGENGMRERVCWVFSVVGRVGVLSWEEMWWSSPEVMTLCFSFGDFGSLFSEVRLRAGMMGSYLPHCHE